MLRNVDLDTTLEKDAYRQLMPEQALALRQLQWQAHEAKLPAMIVFEGWDGSGIGDSFNQLGEALDPRHLVTHAVFDPTQEERYYPFLWRFWTKTPAAGQMALFAPWTLVENEHEFWGRVKVIESLNAAIESALEPRANRAG